MDDNHLTAVVIYSNYFIKLYEPEIYYDRGMDIEDDLLKRNMRDNHRNWCRKMIITIAVRVEQFRKKPIREEQQEGVNFWASLTSMIERKSHEDGDFRREGASD